MAEEEKKPPESNLQKLKLGGLFRHIEKETNEPENVALGQVSKELRYFQRHSQYIQEIERVLKELHVTTALIRNSRTAAVDGMTKQEMLIYYQGILFGLVHQMKDKVMQLVHLMTEEKTPEKPGEEDYIKVAKLLQRKLKIFKEIGIEAEVSEWDEKHPTSKIAAVLRKRTAHEHRVTGLVYNKDFLNLNFTDIASQPQVQEQLSDYGKQQIEKMRLDSEERFYTDAATKAQSALDAVTENVEKICAALIKHFKLPTSTEEGAEIINKYLAMPQSFEVANQCSIEKIPEPHKSMMEDLVVKMREQYKDQVVAVYLVGSLPRGEYEEGYSDINIYFILDEEDETGQMLREDFMFSMRVFTKNEFLSERSRRFRIIAKADGILLHGTDLVKGEKLPKAGMLLALVLYDDILEILDNAKKWMEDNPQASQMQISRKSRRLAKRLIDFTYAVAMSNKPHYTASRKERVEKVVEQFSGRKVIDTLMDVSRYGVGDSESFMNMIEGFRPKAEKNLEKMLHIKNHLGKAVTDTN